MEKIELLRSCSQLSTHIAGSAMSYVINSIDFENEKENRKRNKKEMLRQKEECEKEEEEISILFSQRMKKGKQRIKSEEEDEDDFESIGKKRKSRVDMITISDNEEASCSANPSLVEETKGEKDGRGKMSFEES